MLIESFEHDGTLSRPRRAALPRAPKQVDAGEDAPRNREEDDRARANGVEHAIVDATPRRAIGGWADNRVGEKLVVERRRSSGVR